jgi:hypothetical protein
MNDSILLLKYKFTMSNCGIGNHMCRKMGFLNSELTVVIFPQCTLLTVSTVQTHHRVK